MKIPRAIGAGALIWALIFVEWSILIFTPVFKDLGSWLYAIHYVVLIPIVIFGASVYYKNKDAANGFLIGVIMLITGVILDAVITIPFFTKPQGIGYATYYLNPLMLIGFAELIIASGLYWMMKVKGGTKKVEAPPVQ